MNTNAVLFCYSNQLYQFLSPLMKIYTWIKVINIDVTELNAISPYRPWELLKGRKLLNSIYLQWFAGIPSESRVNFYNWQYALPTFFMVWKIKHKCEIYFADCDYFENTQFRKNKTLYTILKKAFFSMLYPMPFEIVYANDGIKPFPALNNIFFEKSIKQKKPMTIDISSLKFTEIFQNLCYRSDKNVLWLMSPILDLGFVSPKVYKEHLEDCVNIVNSHYSSTEQAIKFHPRTILKEDIWKNSVEIIPDYIPMEFLDMPNLKVVFAFFTTSSLRSLLSNPIVIGLIELIPFDSPNAHQVRRQYFHSSKSNSQKYCPATLQELGQILSSIGREDTQ